MTAWSDSSGLPRYEDAQRDCSLVLDLKPGHVKALYRRAQARTELGNLSAAQKGAPLIESLLTDVLIHYGQI